MHTCCAAAFLVVALAWPVAASSGGVTLTEGPVVFPVLKIAARLLDRLSSQDNAKGDRFAFETTADASIDGTKIPRGTRGVGEVLEAQAARGPRPGILRLAARELDAADAAPISIALAPGDLDVRLDPREPALGSPNGVAVLGIGGRPARTNVVYERGTVFAIVVTASPSPSPSSSPAQSPTPRRS